MTPIVISVMENGKIVIYRRALSVKGVHKSYKVKKKCGFS